MEYDIFIIGAGPGGLTAAIYGTRAGLSVSVADPSIPGGRMAQTHLIENYPGFSEGIDGIDLGERFARQAREWGAEIRMERVLSIVPDHGPWVIKTNKDEYSAKTIIAASGSEPRHLNVPGEKELYGRGVSYCATCDGPLFRDKTVAVIGSGNAALQEADFLTHFAKRVYLLSKKETFHGQQTLLERVKQNEKISVFHHTDIKRIIGIKKVTAIHIDLDGDEDIIDVDGVFVFIGFQTNADYCAGLTDTDHNGRIITDHAYRCGQPGLYAIGDARSKEVFQIANAVGEGAEVIHSIQQYLEESGNR